MLNQIQDWFGLSQRATSNRAWIKYNTQRPHIRSTSSDRI